MESGTPHRGLGNPPVLVKVCGVTTPADAIAVVAAGADRIGLNFHPASPRAVTPARAAEILSALSEPERVVGVFVGRAAADVAAIAVQLGLKTVQLHGDEPAGDVVELRRAGLAVIRAFRLADAAAVARMVAWLEHAEGLGAQPEAVLVDAHVPGQEGGTGRTIAGDVLALVPALGRPLILAGGLRPENVAERVARVRPWMVDVASGVESAPGRKDPAIVAAFIRAARAAGS